MEGLIPRLCRHVAKATRTCMKDFSITKFTHDMLYSENLKAIPCIVDMGVTEFSELNSANC